VTTILAAVLSGVAVLLAGNLPWAALGAANLRLVPQIPWAVLPMAAYLWVYWKFVGGRFGPRDTAEFRRVSLRANPISSQGWALSLLAGLTGFGALIAFLATMGRMMTMPETAPIVTPPAMPIATAVALLTMSSLVAGVTEEAGFRGYMQGPIERRYGLAFAVLVNGAVFGLLHFRAHPDAVIPMLPYYIAVSAVYGGVTFAADSILPAVVLHTGGNVWSLTRLWSTGQPEWQFAGSRSLIWDTGVDAHFIGTASATVLLGAFTILACRAVASTRGTEP
jgi:membrane protease YdiL (CAAX protease family)